MTIVHSYLRVVLPQCHVSLLSVMLGSFLILTFSFQE